MELRKDFTFEAAHRLPNVPASHKCSHLHGHSFRVEVHVYGPVSDAGWVMDFADIGQSFAPIREQLDHRYLNELQGLENPTSENIARWIWARLVRVLPGLSLVRVNETPSAGCTYAGEDE